MTSSPSRDPGSDAFLRQQEVLADLGDRALASGDVDALCADAVSAVVETLDADRCVVIERLPDRRSGDVRASVGWSADWTDGDRTPLSDDSPLGRAIASTDPVVVPDLTAESPPADSLLADASAGGSAITVAIGRPEDPWGVLVATANQPGVFSADDGPFFVNVSNLIATAVEQDHARSDEEEIYGRISDAFFALDDEWRFTYLNDRARGLIAPDDQSLVGRTIWDAFPEAIERKFKAEYEWAMREQETVSFQEYYPEPLDAWFEVRAYPSESGLSVYFHDVTERRVARQQLAEERDMFAEGPAIVFRWRNEAGWPVEYVSENVEETLGYPPEQLESGEVPYTDLLLEEEVDRIAREVAEHSDDDTERFTHEPYRVRTKDGDVRWVTDTTKIVRNDEGEITHYLGYLVDITERKQREEELRRYEAIVEAVDDGVYVVDENGEFTMVNEAYIEMTGYDRDELVGEHVSLVVDEEVMARAQQTEAAMRQDAVDGVTLEADLATKSGDRFPAEASFAMLPTPDGDAERRIGVVRNLTERKQRERELAERERQLSTLIDNVPGMVYRCHNDRDWSMEFVSDGCLDVTGYDPGALERDEVSFGENVVHEDDRERLRREVQAGLEDEGTFHVSYRIVTTEGTVRWVQEQGREVSAEDGTQRIEGVIMDVTERKRLESELEEIFGRVTDAFYALDEEWRFTHVNDRAEELLGRSEEALIGECLWTMFPEAAETDHVRESFEQAMETQQARSFEAYFDPLDFWVDATVYPSETGVSVYFEDATERIERERELERTERRFEAIFEDPNILVGLLDPDGTMIDVNETAMEYIDADIAEVTGEPFWETPWWGEGDDVQDDVMEWTERAANGEYVDFEADLTGPDGREYVLNGAFRPVTNDEGEVVSVIVSDRDVTERREYERQLAENERRYRTIADYFPSGIVTLFDHDLEYTLAAGQGFADVSIDPGDFEGRHFRAVWDEETAAELEPIFEAALEGEERTAEIAYEGREWLVHGVPITDERGEVFAGMTMALDITERKERERELAKYETIVETINDGIYVKDEDGYFTTVNEAYAEMTGYDREELIGAHASLVVDEAVIDQSSDLRTRTADDQQENPTMEAEIQRADGETVPTEGTFARLEADAAVESIGVVRDISERIEQRRRIEESERRYRTLAENFPDGAVGLFDENLEYTAVGGELMDQVDIPKEQRIGNRVTEIYPEPIVQEVEPNFVAALGGEKNSFEIEYHDRHLYAHTLPVRNGDGEVFAGMLVVQDVTERRQAERDLRESEARFRMLAENLDEIVWMASPDLDEIIYVNPAFEDVWGSDRQDVYDDPLAFLDAVHPADRERVKEQFLAIPDEPFDEEYRLRMPDGEIKWVHATGTMIHDEDAEMVRIVGTGQDVTERVERERQLEESERRYRTLAEHFPNGAVGVYDEDLRYTLAEGEMLGENLPNAAVLEGDRMRDIFPPETVADLEPLFRGAVEDGETGSTRTEFGGRDWQVWVTPLWDADEEIFAGLSLAQDVTEQVERERELERALDLLERTERIADVGGWEVDPDTNEPYWSDNLFELLDVDYEDQPTLDQALDVYESEEDRATAENAVERALDSGEPFEVEARFPRPAGDVGWLRIQGDPDVVDGEVVSLRGAVQDVTEQVEREQQLEELIEKLEESNERLEQFAYAASHDLQEPLRMVSSYLRLIEERYRDDLDEDGEEFLAFAVDGADRMREMIDGLLRYSRVDTRGEPLGPVDLEAVLDEVCDDLQVRIEEYDADIDADQLPTVEGDAGQLRQVLQNLLDNAIEYSGDEPPRIDVGARRAGEMWEISVHDEGIGIAPEEADRIFEVFESLHGPEDAGTGIGLALCERIVERHSGDIWVEAEPGDGSAFRFTVPAVIAEDD